MIYDDIKKWIARVETFAKVPGYLSYSLRKESFKNDPLFPDILGVVLEQNAYVHSRVLRKWFESKYADKLKPILSEIHTTWQWRDSFIRLAKKGLLYDNLKDEFCTNFVELDGLCVEGDINTGGNYSIVAYIQKNTGFQFVPDKLKLCFVAFDTSNIYRTTDSIEYQRDRINGICSSINLDVLDSNRMLSILGGVATREVAEQVFDLLCTTKLDIVWVTEILSVPAVNELFTQMLKSPVDECVSKVLSSQLYIPYKDVLMVTNIVGTDDIYTLVNTLRSQDVQAIATPEYTVEF